MKKLLFCTADCNPQYRLHGVISNDFDDETEHDIYGKEYDNLLMFCLSACDFFSLFHLSPSCVVRQLLKPYEVLGTNISSSAPKGTVVYRLCLESMAILSKELGSMFSYFYCQKTPFAPENLTFYRHDESVFLSSVTHDGYCTLTLTDDEFKFATLDLRWKLCE